MGNNCAGVRESTATKLSNASEGLTSGVRNVGSYSRDTLECTKMRVQGYKV